MGGSTSKPSVPPPPPPPPPTPPPTPPAHPHDAYIDIDEDIYEIPEEVKSLLRGRSEVKRYLAGDPVTEWIATLPDEYDDDLPLHPFLSALQGLCHGADISATIISGAIRGVERDPAATFFAFDEYGNIAGFSVTSFDSRYPDDLYREVTCTGLRRQGYGKMLDTAVLDYARSLGKLRVRLEPADTNARRIHTAMGFRPIDRTYMVKDVPPTGGRRRLRRTQKRSFLRKNKQWTRHH